MYKQKSIYDKSTFKIIQHNEYNADGNLMFQQTYDADGNLLELLYDTTHYTRYTYGFNILRYACIG